MLSVWGKLPLTKLVAPLKKARHRFAPRVNQLSQQLSSELNDRVAPKVADAVETVREQLQDVSVNAARKTQAVSAQTKKKVAKHMCNQKPKGHKGLFAVLIALVAAVVGVVLWRRSQPVEDPWAEEYWNDVDVEHEAEKEAAEQ